MSGVRTGLFGQGLQRTQTNSVYTPLAGGFGSTHAPSWCGHGVGSRQPDEGIENRTIGVPDIRKGRNAGHDEPFGSSPV